ncbi:DEAD-box ATP-dependent RNA helicase 31-like [Nymphaea colorata]|nr:DEAD-box ATP-dependent RNA helicase 31-like [Nymphaea colorata]
MPGQLLHLRLLNSAAPVGILSGARRAAFMGSRSSSAAAGASIFARLFPLRLKLSAMSARRGGASALPTVVSGFRQFSSVSRARGGRSASFRRDSPGRGRELRLGGVGGKVQQSKSLIDDEAELSDWISDLRTDRFPRLSDEDSDDGGGAYSGRRRRGEDPPAAKKRKENELGRRKTRGSGLGLDNVDWEGEAAGLRGGRTAGRKQLGSDLNVGMEDFRGKKHGSYNYGGGREGGLLGKRKVEYGKRAAQIFDDDDEDEEIVDFSRKKRGGLGYNRDGREGGVSGKSKMEYGKRAAQIFDDDDEDEEIVDFSRKKRGGLGYNRDGREGGVSGKSKMEYGKRAAQIVDDDDDDEEDGDDESGFESESFSGEDNEAGFDDALSEDKVNRKKSRDDVDVVVPKISSGETDSYLSQSRFEDTAISPLSLKGVKTAGYDKMTVVQEATLPIILKGKDVLAKAKTGTGKTVAFLLPAIELVTKVPPVGRDQKRPPINVLIICPTRELANQAAAEANKLLKYHPSIGVQVVIGGTRLPLEQKRMQANPCQILVATPGRLRDHTENTPGFATRLLGVKMLVLDEADHLLDMGFRKDIEKIIDAVPKQRQTLLFSATVPDEVRQICHIALRRDHEFINTVKEGSEETHSQVKQMHLIAPLDRHFAILYSILNEHIADDPDYKVLVFCTTAMVTKLVSELLSELHLNVREIHSRKPQSYRTRVSDEFRKSKGLILVTSDVSARGVDYPDVTLVVQVGLPSDREQYIHRLGRTGRKGKEGIGILLLAPWEDFFLSNIKGLPISKGDLPPIDPDMRKKVEHALAHVEMRNKEAAYQAWLGYYNSVKTIGRDKIRLVELANEFSSSMGLDRPPAIPKLVLGKMGLKNVPGLRAK